MNEIASAIASAVEEQGSATQEIARNVQQAALGTTEISSNVSGVRQAASDTGAAAHQVLSASSELSRQSEMMRGQVGDLPGQHQGGVIRRGSGRGRSRFLALCRRVLLHDGEAFLGRKHALV